MFKWDSRLIKKALVYIVDDVDGFYFYPFHSTGLFGAHDLSQISAVLERLNYHLFKDLRAEN